jgi:phosphomevalonate decarboxylase
MLDSTQNVARDDAGVGSIAELESLSLRAETMTGRNALLLNAHESIKIIRAVLSLREEYDVPVWYSLDTGASAYLNAYPEYVDSIGKEIEASVGQVVRSGVGGPAHIVKEHLF